jgi:hypothetical protein
VCFVYQQSAKDYQLLQKPGARIFDRSTSFASVTLDPVKEIWVRACAAKPNLW